jgi:hypothetical protein
MKDELKQTSASQWADPRLGGRAQQEGQGQGLGSSVTQLFPSTCIRLAQAAYGPDIQHLRTLCSHSSWISHPSATSLPVYDSVI